jgi:hypothetical protein
MYRLLYLYWTLNVVGFRHPTAVTIPYNIMHCITADVQCFGGSNCFHLQSQIYDMEEKVRRKQISLAQLG